MPVLVTIAAVSYLFGGSEKKQASLLDPVGLRAKIEKLPEGPSRAKAIGLVDRLDLLAAEHDAATDAVIEAYIADVETYSTSTDQLVEDFQSLDQARTTVYRELIEVRQDLIATLSQKEWDRIFG